MNYKEAKNIYKLKNSSDTFQKTKLETETLAQNDKIDNDNIKNLKEIEVKKDDKQLMKQKERNIRRYARHKRKDKIERIIYKCINYRQVNNLNMNKFCISTIIYIFSYKKKGKYKLKNQSKECNEFYNIKKYKK